MARPEARLGLALRRARESRGISLRALARTLQRSHSTLVEFERGHRLAPLDVVEAYEAELGLGAGSLVAVHEGARLELYGEDRSHSRTYVLRPALDAPQQLPPDVAGFTGREAELGKLLFFDRRLSSDGSLSCASCQRIVQPLAPSRPIERGVAGPGLAI